MDLSVIIMAGGLGKRMQSSIPKVLHMLVHKPMLVHVIENAKRLNPKKIYIIVGKYKNVIESTLRTYVNMKDIEFVLQPEALGTGHAIQCALPKLEPNQNVLILSGDVPLLTSQTMQSMITDSPVSLLAADIDEPTGYGRIVQEDGKFTKIVEEKDATEEEKKIQTINAGVYCFRSEMLTTHLPKINNENAQNEYYLTDIFEILNSMDVDMRVVLLPSSKAMEMTGVNTKEQLEELEQKLSYSL